jgi:hypothetical protein
MRIRRRLITIATVAAGALALGGAGAAGPAGAAGAASGSRADAGAAGVTAAPSSAPLGPRASAPVPVSGATPFPGCTAGGTPTSTVFPGAEVEPWIAVNPRDARNIVTYYQQDRWDDGGAHGLVASVTRDGGAHWKQVVVPGLSQCAGGTFERASDPGLSFAPNGDLYEISLSFNVNDFGNAILASKSTDGGLHWTRPATLKSDTEEELQNDKELITADPTNSNRVYAVWDRTNEQGGQPVWFARTTNGGRSWEPAKIIYDPTPGFTIANQIVVLPDGTLVDMFFEGPAGAAEEPDRPFARPHTTAAPLQEEDDFFIRTIRSADHGKTWSKPTTVAQVDSADIVDPDGHQPLRTADIVPDIAVDSHTGRLYVVWQDAGFTQSGAAIMLSSSGDGGRGWTDPARVSKTPDSPAQGNGQAFTAMVDVAAHGEVGVTYYDFRRNTAAAGALTDYWIVTCDAGSRCARGGDAWRERHLGGSFDVTLAPDAGGLFLGDYMGLDHVGSAFRSVFTMTHPIQGNQQDEFVTKAG